MRRRDVILASAGMASTLIQGLSRAAQPCPPPQVSVAGGTSASTTCVINSPGQSYTTSFSVTEDPISEGGKWINGKANGVNWNNAKTNGSGAFAATLGIEGLYDDSIAHLSSSFMSFAANQYSQGTVSRAAGYGTGHEIELLLRFSITSGNARGYEVYWSTNDGLYIVRWNGARGNFTGLAGTVISPAVDGDVLRAEMIGTAISVYRNGTRVLSATDSTWSTGQPGIGFGTWGSAVLTSFGWKNYQAGSL